MTSIGTAHRIFYVARFEEAVYVLHAFEKRARKTPQKDLNMARERYRDLLKARKKGTDAKKR